MCELPTISRPQLSPKNFKFEETQALASYPVACGNTAEALGKYSRQGKTPPPPPTPLNSTDDMGDQGDYYASQDRRAGNHWREGEWGGPDEPKEWAQVAGQWYRQWN